MALTSRSPHLQRGHSHVGLMLLSLELFQLRRKHSWSHHAPLLAIPGLPRQWARLDPCLLAPFPCMRTRPGTGPFLSPLSGTEAVALQKALCQAASRWPALRLLPWGRTPGPEPLTEPRDFQPGGTTQPLTDTPCQSLCLSFFTNWGDVTVHSG